MSELHKYQLALIAVLIIGLLALVGFMTILGLLIKILNERIDYIEIEFGRLRNERKNLK